MKTFEEIIAEDRIWDFNSPETKEFDFNIEAKYYMFIDGVLGQLSDGWGENNPRKWDPYWMNMRVVKKNGNVVLKMGPYCPLAHRPLSEIKKWFADKIKYTVKQALNWENAGEWKRDNKKEVWGYFHDPENSNRRWTIQEAYFVYETLKERDTRKHPEYESFFRRNNDSDETETAE